MATKKNKFTATLVLAFALLVLMVYIFPQSSTNKYKYEQGSPWGYATLYAPFDLDIYLDSATITAKVDSVNKSFVPIYARLNLNVDSLVRLAETQLRNVPDSFNHGDGFADAPDLPGFRTALRNTVANAYQTGIISDADAADTRNIRLVVSPTQLKTIDVASLLTPKLLFAKLDKEAANYSCHTLLINAHIENIFSPTLVPDSELSEQYLEQARGQFTAPRGRILTGQKIIGKGEVITAQDYNNITNYERKLAQVSGESSRSQLITFFGRMVYVALLMLLFLGYIFTYEPRVFASFKTMLFLLASTTLFFALEVIMSWIFASDTGFYLVPIPIIPILILVFFNGRLALAAALYLILLCAPLTTFPIEFIFLQAVASGAAVLSLRDLTQRSQLLKTSAIVTIALWLSYLSLNIMTNGSFDDFSWRMAGAITIAGVLTAMAYILMSLVERVFGFISNVTLVELADTNTPLLRQLSDECPGTFQHSIAVSNLAGDAARLIGANVLLTRAGALYHDIGKLTNPVFYTENQHGVNPHDGLSPLKSAEIIISHVTEGLKRADKAGLPSVIKDFIAQHHGAGKAKYFYFTYCKQHPDEKIDPAPFTYPGPNPSSREASVLMMADSVEAASRSLSEHTPQAIRQLVDKIIDSQIADGLHNDSSLSFRDVRTIKDAFTRRLMTIYHSRISYPEDPTKKKSPESLSK